MRLNEKNTTIQNYPEMKKILQFKITLKGIDPPIWRRIQISEESTFDDLHRAIQDSMGWLDYHLYTFLPNGDHRRGRKALEIGIPSEDGQEYNEMIDYDSRKTKVIDFLKKKMLYLYDFGDDWYWEILFEGTFPAVEKTKYPLCLDGERACPPEDVGGPYGYATLVEAISDENHPDHEEYCEWVDEEFDPEFFDLKQIKFRKQKTLIT